MRIGVVFPSNEIGGDTGAVRAFAQAPVGSGKGELTLTAPADARGPEVDLIAMVQHQGTRAILAATRVTR